MRKTSRIFYIIATIVVLLIGVDSVNRLLDSNTEQSAANDDLTRTPDHNYSGSESCQSCHRQQYDDWKNSFHDMAMAEADSASVKGKFDTTFTSQGVTSRFYRKGDKFYVNTEGPDGGYHDYEVTYTFGAQPLQQYLVKFPDGRLQCLRTAWDTEKRKWFDLYPDDRINPDEWLHWSRGGLNWNTMCSDCHSTNVRKNFNEDHGSFNTTYSLLNVGCEACHGPAGKHVDNKLSPGSGRPEFDLVKSDAPGRQTDQCARCHSRRVQFTETYRHPDEFMDHYVPELLRDDLYYPDGQIRDEVYVYGSFVQSKMYKNNVKCSDCHNPHSLKLKAVGNNLCGQCHALNVYDSPSHHFHSRNTESAQCVNCHMPGRYYMGNDFRRDHSFRIPRPDLSAKYGTPNACNGCHTDKSEAWAAEAIVKWYGPERKFHFSEVLALASTRSEQAVAPLIRLSIDSEQPAIARATAIWYLDQFVSDEATEAIVKSLESKDDIVKYTAINALADMPADQRIGSLTPLLKDNRRTIRLSAASALADIPIERINPSLQADFVKNTREYERSLKVRADFPGGQLEKGMFYYRRGQIDLAEQAYLKAIAFDNRFNAARLNLAYLYNGQGKNEAAIALFKTIIEQEPAFGLAYYSLGLLYAEENRMVEAIAYLSKSTEFDKSPRVYYNLGIAYQQVNLPKEAERTFLEGLQRDSDNEDLMYVLSVLYVQRQEFAKARPYVEKLGKLHPGNPQIREMMTLVMARR